ncbi:hypothetical protein SAY87_026540 [Trapa incisa]|uniref:Selenoprotein H n=1 Tax=Trapa incisa TaxID=236973 RepID=A0AAN7JE92_9MYRT|nr:hypothetical protein SAY87_026540 [Trapa incisa]
MAPRKRMHRQAEGDGVAPPQTTRMTRSSALRILQDGSALPELPPQKKQKTLKRKKEKSVKPEKDAGTEETVGGVTATKSEGQEVKEAQPLPSKVKGKERTVVIEHCKQCNSFKTRALQVKNGLESGVSGIIVLVNPDKPRRGCFEVREEGGEKFVSLLGMKRPFTPMKALDMEKVVLQIIEKLNGVQ